MSRLQVGGLALVIKAINPDNIGVTVQLIGRGKNYDWIVEGNLSSDHIPDTKRFGVFVANSDQLLPLGDEEGRKLYKLEEEKLESKNVTTL